MLLGKVIGIGGEEVTVWERQNWDQGIAVFTNVIICTSWFLFTRLFYAREPASYRQAIDEFSQRVETPVDYATDETEAPTDDRQSWLIGWLCLPYGAVVVLMMLIPNPWLGRAAFAFSGGVVMLIGWALVRQARPSSV